eukprot:Skav216413  [mRNA]  locus=scaffold457:542706:548462:+ [translate_table: standard]
MPISKSTEQAAASGAAKQELFELVEYDLERAHSFRRKLQRELPKGALKSGLIVSIKSPSKGGVAVAPGFAPTGSALSDPATVFHCCDTDGSGTLDFHELKFAFNAFGLFPNKEYLSSWMDDQSTVTFENFEQLLDSKLRSAPTSMKGPRAVPYARRGILMQQVEDLYQTFIHSGWLQQQCDIFNAQHQSLGPPVLHVSEVVERKGLRTMTR